MALSAQGWLYRAYCSLQFQHLEITKSTTKKIKQASNTKKVNNNDETTYQAGYAHTHKILTYKIFTHTHTHTHTHAN